MSIIAIFLSLGLAFLLCMAIWTLGINHKTATVAVRERVSFDPASMTQVLSEVRTLKPIREVVILSTCNRTEIYGSAEQDLSPQVLVQWLSQFHDIDAKEIEQALYFYQSEQAVQHAMRVASGLDSLVLGEPQILGQMKSAYSVAQDAGTVGSEMGRLFRQTFSVAKRVRTETAIGENPVSVAFAAVRMAQRIFSEIGKSTALLVGAGETIELVARHLKQAGVHNIIVANRTLVRAQQLALEVDAEAILLEQIPDYLPKADIVISSTASPLPILGKGMVERALKLRRHKPMFMVDIAVPRDIEPQVGDLSDVYLYTVDDLRNIIEENVRSREEAAKQAESLIDAGVINFMRDIKTLDAVKTLTDLRSSIDKLREEQLNKALKQLEHGVSPEEVLRHFAHSFTNKVLHPPTTALRKASADGRLEVLDWTRELFNLTKFESPK